jgi:hypothetical protein
MDFYKNQSQISTALLQDLSSPVMLMISETVDFNHRVSF